ncbi:MAG: lipoate--protein ligase [Desulfovibrionaceae bacterium]|nr:lipoate--protein ligase [Desulfovibrionaceae bacterium]
MLALLLEQHDPCLNLALEEHLFRSLQPDDEGWFLLWRNAPSLIVGRHQNTVEEVNQQLVQRHALPVVRRNTGGGAVYHDLGNVNFSFLHTAKQAGSLDFSLYLKPVVAALAAVGIQASFSSRNDLTAAGRKFSGSAQMRHGNKVLHHGTLLVDLDLDMLGAVLTGAPDKYQSKGIASVRSRVVNLSDIWPAGCSIEAVQQSLLQHCATGQGALPCGALEAAEQLAAEKYRTWAWNYGKSPAFTTQYRQRFAWGAVECRLAVRHGRIESFDIFGDFFAEKELDSLCAQLQGIAFTPAALHAALAPLPLEQWFTGCDAGIMRHFLAEGGFTEA